MMRQTDAGWTKDGACYSNLFFVFIGFAAISLWSTIPFTIRILTTLQHRSGTFFWSLMATTWGLCIRQIGMIAKTIPGNCPWWLAQVMLQLGWIMMVSGFSMVLYSRLSIITNKHRLRRAVLAMIITNGLIWHTAMTTISFGKISARKNKQIKALKIWERIHGPFEKWQIAMFTLQEVIIACFYIRMAYQYLQGGFAQKKKVRKAVILLLVVQLVVVAVDIAMIVTVYMGLTTLKVSVNSFSYAIKLEMEFVVLEQLVKLSKLGVTGISTATIVGGDVEKGKESTSRAEQTPSRNSTLGSTLDDSFISRSTTQSSMSFITMPQNLRSN